LVEVIAAAGGAEVGCAPTTALLNIMNPTTHATFFFAVFINRI
jgi:hypothetical protein